jgi:hypothetical protein
MTDTLDLTETLASAAAEAVRVGHLRGITIDVETANGGSVLDVTSYLMWRQTWRST